MAEPVAKQQAATLARDWIAPVRQYLRNNAFAQSLMFQRKRLTLWGRGQNPALLDPYFILRYINHTGGRPTAYAYGHGADQLSYIGSGILYFAIPYMLRAQTCLCIGSGGGFVPRLICQAQRDARIPNAKMILVDGAMGDWGRPNYMDAGSLLRRQFRGIEIVRSESSAYAREAHNRGLRIDYLHIDGDHSYEGALADFKNFAGLVSPHGLITMHDTGGKLPCAALIADLQARGHQIVNVPGVGAGVAIIQVNRDALEEPDFSIPASQAEPVAPV